MINFKLMYKSIKVAWIKRFCDENKKENDWQIIPLETLKYVGKRLIFESNFNIDKVPIGDVDIFYKEILQAWESIKKEIASTQKHDIKNEILWNNKHIVIEENQYIIKLCILKASSI